MKVDRRILDRYTGKHAHTHTHGGWDSLKVRTLRSQSDDPGSIPVQGDIFPSC